MNIPTLQGRADAVIAAITKTCPLRVQVASQTTAVSPTGGLISGGFSALGGHESIPAQRVMADAAKPEIVEAGGKSVLVSHTWTLPGAWPQIPERATLREMVAGSAVAEYEILMADVHCFGLHTDLKTRRLKR